MRSHSDAYGTTSASILFDGRVLLSRLSIVMSFLQILTWGKPKPESVKDFKVPGIFWKAHERDESANSKIPIYLCYTTKDGEKGGEHKFQAASVKKNAKNTHECIVFLDANGTARIERLQGAHINLNEKVGQVPSR